MKKRITIIFEVEIPDGTSQEITDEVSDAVETFGTELMECYNDLEFPYEEVYDILESLEHIETITETIT